MATEARLVMEVIHRSIEKMDDLGVMEHACNPSTLETDVVESLQLEASLVYKQVSGLHSENLPRKNVINEERPYFLKGGRSFAFSSESTVQCCQIYGFFPRK